MFVDLFFLLLLFGMLMLGFFQGVIRMTIILVSFYLGVVLASYWFKPFGVWIAKNFDTTNAVGRYVGFSLLFMAGMAILSAIGIYTFRYAEMPGQLKYLNFILGMLVALVLAGLFLGLFAVILWNMMVERGGCTIDFPVMKLLCRHVKQSFLLKYFSDHILASSYNFADPILPDDASIIFAVPQSTTPIPE
ncbi:MAG: CvpA family protein [Chloroflexaceae bacterium]|nr:CvpA family protein [Chloroflexaceae bacterium]